MVPLATAVPASSAAPSLTDTRFSGADAALGMASVARTVSKTARVGEDAGSQHTACCSHSSGGNLLALCCFCGHKESRAWARDKRENLGWPPKASPLSQLWFG